MDIFQQVGKNVREIRLKRDLTQEAVADVAGISPHFLSNIERGKEKLSLTTLSNLSKSLKVDPTSLLGGIKETSKTDNDLVKLTIAYEKLSLKQKQTALPLILNIINTLKEL